MQTELKPKDNRGNQHGLWLERYYTNNQIMYTGEYIHGKMHGPWIGYYENGNLCYKENFDMGKVIGYCIEYWDDGELNYKRFYAN
jgi:antitoxin component YwqK of YwqJK toxin-antitoxin module